MEGPQFKSRLSDFKAQAVSIAEDENSKVNVEEVYLKCMGRVPFENVFIK